MKNPLCFAILCGLAVTVAARGQLAGDIPASTQAVKTEPPPIQFHVLQSWKSDLGNRCIYLNRVAPPVLPAAPIKAQQENPQISETALAQILASEKKSEVLFLSATVYDHKVTEISGMEDGRAWRVFSNIDFNLLSGAVTFESADTDYSLLLAVNNMSRQFGQPLKADNLQDLEAVNTENIPALDKLSATQAQYIVADDVDGATPSAKKLAAFDALHVFYDANCQQLADAYAKREAARFEQESKPKVQPPKPPDTVVNFWPGNGTVVIDAASKRMKP